MLLDSIPYAPTLPPLPTFNNLGREHAPDLNVDSMMHELGLSGMPPGHIQQGFRHPEMKLYVFFYCKKNDYLALVALIMQVVQASIYEGYWCD